MMSLFFEKRKFDSRSLNKDCELMMLLQCGYNVYKHVYLGNGKNSSLISAFVIKGRSSPPISVT
jgi:hypothetical protein